MVDGSSPSRLIFEAPICGAFCLEVRPEAPCKPGADRMGRRMRTECTPRPVHPQYTPPCKEGTEVSQYTPPSTPRRANAIHRDLSGYRRGVVNRPPPAERAPGPTGDKVTRCTARLTPGGGLPEVPNELDVVEATRRLAHELASECTSGLVLVVATRGDDLLMGKALIRPYR